GPLDGSSSSCASASISTAMISSMDLSKTGISNDGSGTEDHIKNETNTYSNINMQLSIPPVTSQAAIPLPGTVVAAAPHPTLPPVLPLPHPLQLIHQQQLQLRHNQFLQEQEQQQQMKQHQLIESNQANAVIEATAGSHNSLVVTASNNNNNNLHKCRLCPFTTSNPYTFTRHLRIHSGSKEFRCRVCHFASSRKDSLIRHFRMKHLMGEMALYQEMDSKDIEELALLKDTEPRPWYKSD
ncbi:unnamed protein product, partial [Meganyctiphanes norvegica]